jgi:hypothetical protein
VHGSLSDLDAAVGQLLFRQGNTFRHLQLL